MEQIFSNARIVLPDAVLHGSLKVGNGGIEAIDSGNGVHAGAMDAEGDYLLPGLIDLHTDNLEKHYQPRYGVVWDAVSAAISHDTQIIGSGITTVFDSLTLGSNPAWDSRDEMIRPMIEGLRVARQHGMLKAEHLLHMRCEVTHAGIIPAVRAHLNDPLFRFMSLMDHAPGDRQSPDIEDYRRRYLLIFDRDEAAVDRHIAGLIQASRVLGPGHRSTLGEIARDHQIPLASHDDAKPDHVREAAELGAVLTEFPTTLEAASTARALGLKVLMGSPNLMRGGSHSGNLSAGELARRRHLDILSSDYIPSSLLPAAFMLTDPPFDYSLPEAIATVTRVPAMAARLHDRGQIAPGLRADLLQVRMVAKRPIVRAVWVAGARVA